MQLIPGHYECYGNEDRIYHLSQILSNGVHSSIPSHTLLPSYAPALHMPRPTCEERVWWRSADCLLSEENFPTTNHNTICGCKFFVTSAQWHSTFLACKLVISSPLCLQQAMNVNETWGISWMSPDPLLAGEVWARDYLPALHTGKG